MKTRFFDPPKPRLFGHRGSAHYPENTMPAFQDAINAGLQYLELDVWLAKDGVVMVHHDKSLQRICGEDYQITDLTCKEFKVLDAGRMYTPDEGQTFPFRDEGIRVPTLDEVLSSFQSTFYTIEIKQKGEQVVEEVLAAIKKTNCQENVLVASSIDEVNKIVRRLNPDIPTNLAYNEVHEFYRWMAMGAKTEYNPPGSALQIPQKHGDLQLVTPESVNTAHALGLEMHIWTVNDFKEMLDLLKMGVDGIMSDYPNFVKKACLSIG